MSTPVVLDTNVWVSAFLNPHGFPAKLLDAWFDGTALSGEVHFLVSRDEDLTRDQPLAAYLASRGITVITVARFLQHLTESP